VEAKKDVFIACESSFNKADIVILGAGFDSTTTYRPGARFAPAAIRRESYSIETFSPYQNKDLADLKVCDTADLELPISDTKKTLKAIQNGIEKVLKSNKFPLLIGGEHLVTLGAVRAVLNKHPDICIVHFDAHADLRDDYLSDKLSHSTVMRRCFEELNSQQIFQFGIRSGEKQEFEFAKNLIFMTRFNFDNIEHTLQLIKGKRVYFTVDMDVLDPSQFPGTGTPEAGGVSFLDLLAATKTVFDTCDVVAFDMVELNPMVDPSGISTSLSCKYLREVLLYIGESLK